MTFIKVNNVEISPNNDLKTVGELLNFVLDKHSNENDIITSIRLDDTEVDSNDKNNIYNESTENFTQIKIETKTKHQLVEEALISLSEYIDYLNKKIRYLSEKIKVNNFDTILFIEIIDGIELFTQLVTTIHRTLKFNTNLKVGNLTLKELQIHMLSILKALLPAKQKDDYVMICDLLEFELIDNLTQWKTGVIPTLKKYLQSR